MHLNSSIKFFREKASILLLPVGEGIGLTEYEPCWIRSRHPRHRKGGAPGQRQDQRADSRAVQNGGHSPAMQVSFCTGMTLP